MEMKDNPTLKPRRGRTYISGFEGDFGSNPILPGGDMPDTQSDAELQRLRNDFDLFSRETGQIIQQLTDALSQVQSDGTDFDIGKYLQAGKCIDLFQSGNVMEINSTGGSITGMCFGVTTSGLNVTVAAGTLRLHSIGKYAVAETVLACSGDPLWIYISHARDHSTTAAAFSASEPVTTTTTLMIPLAKFNLNGTGTGYTLEYTCHIGDISLDVPLS